MKNNFLSLQIKRGLVTPFFYFKLKINTPYLLGSHRTMIKSIINKKNKLNHLVGGTLLSMGVTTLRKVLPNITLKPSI